MWRRRSYLPLIYSVHWVTSMSMEANLKQSHATTSIAVMNLQLLLIISFCCSLFPKLPVWPIVMRFLLFSSFVSHQICDQVVADSAKAWRNYIKEQLYKGGDKLFKYIAKEDKAFANVHFVDDKGTSMSPEAFPTTQSKKMQIPRSP